MRIRSEQTADAHAVRAVNEAAFGSSEEAGIVEALRERLADLISLVAESDGQVVGHILYSPVSLSGHPEARIMGLGPLAVLPTHQRKGIGSALVREGLSQCQRAGYCAVLVLGHPDYYPRFGFVPASRYRIRSEYDVPDDVFMLIELEPGSMKGLSGLITYDDVFAGA